MQATIVFGIVKHKMEITIGVTRGNEKENRNYYSMLGSWQRKLKLQWYIGVFLIRITEKKVELL